MCTRELLKRSADMQYYKGQIAILSVVAGIMIVCMLLVSVAVQDFRIMWVSLAPLAVWAPFIIYYISKIRGIFKDIDHYQMTEVVLNEAHAGMARTLYFTVQLENGMRLDTNSVFMIGGLLAPRFDDYSNKRVQIAYNQITAEIVVLKLL